MIKKPNAASKNHINLLANILTENSINAAIARNGKDAIKYTNNLTLNNQIDNLIIESNEQLNSIINLKVHDKRVC